MKIQSGKPAFAPAAARVDGPIAADLETAAPMDRARGTSLAAFSGAVQSRRTYAYTPVRVRQPQPNVVSASAKIDVADVKAALSDARVPNIGITVNGNTIQVDGLSLSFAVGENGETTFTGKAVNLRSEQVDAAVKKLAGLANVARVLRHIANNPQMMVEPKILAAPNGAIDIKFVAKVKVNPKLEKQADYVLGQHTGELTMPQRKAAAVASRRRRGVVST